MFVLIWKVQRTDFVFTTRKLGRVSRYVHKPVRQRGLLFKTVYQFKATWLQHINKSPQRWKKKRNENSEDEFKTTRYETQITSCKKDIHSHQLQCRWEWGLAYDKRRAHNKMHHSKQEHGARGLCWPRLAQTRDKRSYVFQKHGPTPLVTAGKVTISAHSAILHF